MADETGNFQIVYNGEVYNFKELRSELESLGYRFQSDTDTEVVLRAYQAWGVGCLGRLQGMFAFAIWEKINRRLFLARDRLGIKPLFYSTTSTSFIFASELKALLQDSTLDRTTHAGALDQYFSFGYIPAPNTVFKSVQKLPPAHFLIWEKGQVHIKRFWRYGSNNRHEEKSVNAWVGEFGEVLRRVVSRQMVSDVPVGAFLSGGVDSSLIVWMMSDCSDQQVKTFTIGFPEKQASEAPFARLVAEQFGAEHHEYEVTPDALEILPKLVWHLDEPFGDSSIVPTYFLSLMTRQLVTVALSGDGGDELFAGYTRYQGERLSNIIQILPKRLRSILLDALKLPSLRRAAILRRLGNVLSDAQLDFVSRYSSKASLCQPEVKMSLYSDDFRDRLKEDGFLDPFVELGKQLPEADFIERLTLVDLEFYLPNDMLTKVDRMSMASSLEVRVPFLDEELVEVASRIPNRLKLRGFTTKYLLRKLASQALPPKIWRRRKQGFGMPVQAWFKGDLAASAKEILLDSQAVGRGYFRQSAIEKLLDEQQAGSADYGNFIFALLCFEFWSRSFADSKGLGP